MISVTPAPDGLAVLASGEHGLTGAAFTIVLPDGCVYGTSRAGDFLEQRGTPLSIAGPRSDGAIVAGVSLTRGMEGVSGDGILLRLETMGVCTDARLADITLAHGDLPSTGAGTWPAAALVLLVCMRRIMDRRHIS